MYQKISRSQSPSYSLTPGNFLSHSKSKHGPKYTTKKEAHDVYDPYVEENVLPPCPSTSECYKGPDEWEIETPTGDTKVGVAQLDGSADENEVDEGNNRPKCTDSEKSKTELSNAEHNEDSTTNDSTKETPGVHIPYINDAVHGKQPKHQLSDILKESYQDIQVNANEDSQKSVESLINANTCLAPKNLKVFNFLLKLKVYPFY